MPAKSSSKKPSLRDRFIVKPRSKVRLADHDPGETFGYRKDQAMPKIDADLKRLAALQERLWAEHKRRLLIVLQGIDAAGKDGTVKHVMTGFNPAGVRVVGFGVPSEVELAHDYLWRVHQVVPGNGEITIFNRSHYEDVLIVRVHNFVPQERWSQRYDQINAWEEMLAAEGTTILKFMLNISPAEQLQRLKERYDDPTKRWKFKIGDLEERKRWDDYMAAYEAALSRCSTDAAPWFVIPSDKKWFRDLAIADIVADTLDKLDPQYPPMDDLPKNLVIT